MMTRQLRANAMSIVLLSIATTMMTGVTSQSFPMEKPSIRYQPFANLDENAQIVVQQLGYTASTWNNHGLANIERERWDTLTSSQQEAAIQLGFGEKAWDCFINHYLAYTWVQLATLGVQDEYVKLGWTDTNWMATTPTDVPFTESLWWDELSVSEKVRRLLLLFKSSETKSPELFTSDKEYCFPSLLRPQPMDYVSSRRTGIVSI